MPKDTGSENSRPWDRRPRESEEAYASFLHYRDLGAKRSLDAVGVDFGGEQRGSKRGAKGQQESNKRATTGRLGKWSTDHEWVERCRAWDNHIQAERDAVAFAAARQQEERCQRAIEETYQLAQVLRSKVARMLAFPLQTTKVETYDDGRTKTIISPAKWTFLAAAQMLKLAVEIEEAALAASGKDLEDMSEAEMEGIASVGLKIGGN